MYLYIPLTHQQVFKSIHPTNLIFDMEIPLQTYLAIGFLYCIQLTVADKFLKVVFNLKLIHKYVKIFF